MPSRRAEPDRMQSLKAAVWAADLGGLAGLERVFLQRMQVGIGARSFHTHRGAQWLSITGGRGRFDLQPGQTWILEPGDTLVVAAEVPHRWMETGPDGIEVLAITAWGTPAAPELAAVMSAMEPGRVHRKFVEKVPELKSRIEALADEAREPWAGRPVAVAGRTLELLVASARAGRAQEEAGPQRAGGTPLPGQYVSRARAYMAQNLARPIALTHVAEELGISVSHLVRLFRRQTGTSPMRMLAQMRVEAARNLLVTTDRSAGQIAQRVGLTSVQYLSRVFSRVAGESPRAYRRRVLESGLEG